jgi:DNA polymerase III subunit epsilon
MLGFIKRQLDWMALKDRSYEYLFAKHGTDEVVSVDCETTGLNPKKDDIVSIAAVKIRKNEILTSEAYRVTVKPKANLEADSIKIHQIRPSDVAGGLSILHAMPDFLEFIGNRPLVGYWINFDIRMLNKTIFPMLNITLQNPRIDVCDMYYDRKYGKAPPGTKIDLRFAAILEDLQLPPLQAHDALNDAISTAQMYLILKDLKARGVRLKRVRNWDQPSVPVG